MQRIAVVLTAYELNGRTNQKRRTRVFWWPARVEATACLAEGRTPTVGEVAEQVRCYLQDDRLPVLPEPTSPPGCRPPGDRVVYVELPDATRADVIAVRLDIVVAAYTWTILDNESQQRTMLRLSTRSRSRGAIAVAAPARTHARSSGSNKRPRTTAATAATLEARLSAIAIRSATGIEALSWLTDVAGLSREDAAALMRWSAHAMLDATTAGPSGTRRKRSRGRPGAATSP